MQKKLLLQEERGNEEVEEITLFEDPEKLKLILNRLSWKILSTLSDKEMYPLELARKLGIHEQKVYYHVRKLLKAGAVAVARQEEKKGAIAKFFKPVSPAFGIELIKQYRARRGLPGAHIGGLIRSFFSEFVYNDGAFDGKIVVGSPDPHGPFKTSARDGHYASYLTFFMGQFTKLPEEFVIKLDVDVKVEKEEANNLVLVGGPGTNVETQEINDRLPIRFNMRPSDEGFLLGGLVSTKTKRVYTNDAAGLVAKIPNPWNPKKRVIVLAGNKAVGTKACVLALTQFWKKTLENYKGESTFARAIQGYDLNSDGKVDSIEVLE